MRALTRDDAKVADRWWRDRVEVVEGDAGSAETLATALDGVDVAYYFLHSMDGGGELRRARPRARPHLRRGGPRGRRRPHRLPLRAAPRPRAAERPPRLPGRGRRPADGQRRADGGAAGGVILGSGSASFEMLRHLTTRLPVMVTPKWLDNRIQPIAVRDVLHYLVRRRRPAARGQPHLRRRRPRGAHLPRDDPALRPDRRADAAPRSSPCRCSRPYLASQWVGFVTPVPTGVAKPLVGSLLHEVVCAEHDLDDLVGPPPGGAAALRPGRGRRRRRRPAPTRDPSRAPSTPRASPAPTPAWAGGRGSGGS